MSGLWNSFISKFKKKDSSADKTPPEPTGQDQYKVNKTHNYDEVNLDEASTAPNWDVDKKPRNYDQIDLKTEESEQSKE